MNWKNIYEQKEISSQKETIDYRKENNFHLDDENMIEILSKKI